MMFNYSYPHVLHQLRYIENDTSFRSSFEYNNVLYSLAGYCAARANNTTWNYLIKHDLLDPLGMTTTTTSYKDFLKSKNHATPYNIISNLTLTNYDVIIDPLGPSGIIGCSISEMANWLKFQIADTGKYNGKQIVSKKNLEETRTGQIKISDIAQYGLGWYVIKKNPLNLASIGHGGATAAFKSQVTIYTSKGIGIAIFTNEAPFGSIFRTALDTKFKDLLMGNETSDYWPLLKNATEKTAFIPKPGKPTPPIVKSLPLNYYTGIYYNNFYGKINIITANNKLACYYGNNKLQFNLTHWNGDVFVEPTNNHAFNFTDIFNKRFKEVTLDLSDPPTPATFNRTK